jgi:choline kinase
MPNFIHEINNSHKTNFIILSAGENKTRGQCNAKSLLHISKGKKLLDSQIQTIRKHFQYSEIIFVVGFQSNILTEYLLEKYPEVRIVENKKYKTTTPLESLRLSLNCCICGDTYVIYGDKYFDIDSIRFDDSASPVIVESTHESFSKSDLGLVYQNNKLKSLSYGVKKKWGQIFYIPKTLFYDFRKKVNTCNKNYYNVFDIINSITQNYEFKIHKSRNLKEIS